MPHATKSQVTGKHLPRRGTRTRGAERAPAGGGGRGDASGIRGNEERPPKAGVSRRRRRCSREPPDGAMVSDSGCW